MKEMQTMNKYNFQNFPASIQYTLTLTLNLNLTKIKA